MRKVALRSVHACTHTLLQKQHVHCIFQCWYGKTVLSFSFCVCINCIPYTYINNFLSHFAFSPFALLFEVVCCCWFPLYMMVFQTTKKKNWKIFNYKSFLRNIVPHERNVYTFLHWNIVTAISGNKTILYTNCC